MVRNIIIILLPIFICSCSLPKGWNWGLRPRPIGFWDSMPSTDTLYGQGFREGCMTGWKAVGKGLLGDMSVKFNPTLMTSSKDYSSGWSDGYDYCVDTMDHDVP